ncbi:MAG: efflux RND transporter permease subunit [Salinisphaeraceae bacterium]
MLGVIIDLALRLRGVVLALAVMLFGYGGWMLSQAGLDIFPEFSPKQVVIQTEAPGLTAEQAEVQVSQPIENALAGLNDLKLIRSQSMQGLSVVTLIFQPDTDIYRNRQIVAERLGTVDSRLPPGVAAPVINPLSSSSATVMTIGVTSPSRSLMDLRDAVDGTLVPRLLSVSGVADVNVFGGDIRQLQIQVDPEALQAQGVSLAQVRSAAMRATGVQGAGFLANRNQQLPITVTGTPETAASLREVTVQTGPGGRRLQLADIATVEEAPAPAFGAAQVMGEPGVVMMVIGQYQSNTLTVSRNIEAALDDLDVVLAADDIELHDHLFRPADYIEASFASIAGHLLVGAGFVILVLLVFLYNWRAAVISALAIPLSLLGATILLLAFGVNLNVMVLGGLAIALGEVVDDAIIDTENIARRLRENRALQQPRSFLAVIYDASMEVRGSVVYATFIVVLAFVPLLTLGGVAGRLFAPLGLAYILAILVSLVVALTITPALAAMLLTGKGQRSDEPPVTRWLKPRYERTLARIGTRPRLALGVALAVSAGGIALLPLFGGAFLPELREGHYIVHTTSLPGTSLDESIRHGKQLTERWREIPGIRSVSQWAGRAERGADTYGTHYSEYEIDFEKGLSGPEQQAIIDALNAVLRDFPGISYESNTFLTERIDETISGYTAPVVINIFGHDLRELDRLAAQVAEVIREVPGAAEVQVRSSADVPLLAVDLDNARLTRHGIAPMYAVAAIRTAYRGDVVGHYYEGNRRREVNLILAPEDRRNPASVAELPIADGDGRLRPLSDLARVEQVAGRYNVLHEGAQRVQVVTADVDGRDLASFFDDLRNRVLDDVTFSADTYPEFTGAALEQAEARRELILHSLLAGGAILIMIFVALGNLRNTALVLLNLPFSLVGGVVAAWLTGGWLSIGSLVGFVTLFGITVRNSIMLASHYRYLVVDEGLPWNAQTARRGARERLTAILVTALVTALAMLPIAIGSDNPGREIMGPMAAIIIGGLVSSTILNLLILPSVFLRFGRFASS